MGLIPLLEGVVAIVMDRSLPPLVDRSPLLVGVAALMERSLPPPDEGGKGGVSEPDAVKEIFRDDPLRECALGVEVSLI